MVKSSKKGGAKRRQLFFLENFRALLTISYRYTQKTPKKLQSEGNE